MSDQHSRAEYQGDVTKADAPPRMTDKELIDFLRKQLWQLEEAVSAMGDAMTTTSQEREGAYHRMIIVAECYADKPSEHLAQLLVNAVRAYDVVMGQTGPKRSEAWAALQRAMMMDFYEALQASPDMTEEMMAGWFASPPAPEMQDVAGVKPVGERAVDLEPFGMACEWRELGGIGGRDPLVAEVRIIHRANGALEFWDPHTNQRYEGVVGFRHPDYDPIRTFLLPKTPGVLLHRGDPGDSDSDWSAPAFLTEVVYQ